MKIRHLVKRFFGSISHTLPTQEQVELVRSILMNEELILWSRMQARDQRHSVEVLERFTRLVPESTRSEQAAALLHDIGKIESQLGLVGRVLATIIGPRGKYLSSYHEHEKIGTQLVKITSDQRTIDLVSGQCEDEVAMALRAADDI
jgi:hypothetical protein